MRAQIIMTIGGCATVVFAYALMLDYQTTQETAAEQAVLAGEGSASSVDKLATPDQELLQRVFSNALADSTEFSVEGAVRPPDRTGFAPALTFASTR